jgi:hypothetical protein
VARVCADRPCSGPQLPEVRETLVLTFIREVLGSNLGQDTGYPDGFCGFLQSRQIPGEYFD